VQIGRVTLPSARRRRPGGVRTQQQTERGELRDGTNWQAYRASRRWAIVQMAGLAVQDFASAAVGVCVAGGLVRGSPAGTDQLSNFWVDLSHRGANPSYP